MPLCLVLQPIRWFTNPPFMKSWRCKLRQDGIKVEKSEFWECTIPELFVPWYSFNVQVSVGSHHKVTPSTLSAKHGGLNLVVVWMCVVEVQATICTMLQTEIFDVGCSITERHIPGRVWIFVLYNSIGIICLRVMNEVVGTSS